jgi:hypothetical protein
VPSFAPLWVTLLYWEGCPSHAEALARLRRVLDEEGVTAEVDVVRVDSAAEAEQRRFVGFPERTPEVFVFDRDRGLRYHGAIDDHYEDAANVRVPYLRNALGGAAASGAGDGAGGLHGEVEG